jgi:hypothetical protein
MKLLNEFSMTLSEVLGIEPQYSVAVLSLAILDSGKNPYDKLGYADFKQIFQNALRKRLIWMQVKEEDKIVARMLQALDEKQSLFTMAIH